MKILKVLILVACCFPIAGIGEPDPNGCRENIKCWGTRHRADAYVRCVRLIQGHAAYDYKWTSWIDRFGDTFWGDRERGSIILMGDKIKFQNAFGAWRKMTYRCEYDPETQTAHATVR